ncbi:hypothetical protein ElyMa_006048000 [Elysia marginata]|uniref:HTH psq-type domain-containing protein n=1 Tax=Elysia marginata TaxID=1093978 RepID=A0AAV4GMJ2_9GAST|nr:hypothetical protein ElyMa_006048000 [Elysia marginata]
MCKVYYREPSLPLWSRDPGQAAYPAGLRLPKQTSHMAQVDVPTAAKLYGWKAELRMTTMFNKAANISVHTLRRIKEERNCFH